MGRFFSGVLKFFCEIITWVSIIAAIIWSLIFFAPKAFGIYPYVVMSGSMEPSVHVGSLAYVDLLDEDEEFMADDILAYRTQDGTMVLHRLVGMGDTGYVFKGDANETYDLHSVNEEDIFGMYAWSIPYMGYAGAWVSNHSINIGPVELPAVVPFMIGIVLVLNVACAIIDKADGGDEQAGEPDGYMGCHIKRHDG